MIGHRCFGGPGTPSTSGSDQLGGNRNKFREACLRCPLLQPDPAQKRRLDEIIVNLHERLAEAHERGWLGEVEGLEMTIAAAEQTLASMSRQINLGMPVIPPRRHPDPS
ncbi:MULTISPECIES: hypothetical protein [Streptomyces]|uniref:Transposase n=1 Tax=Streptomyces flavovirens TaxID=52258 RepID=A0ABV8N3X5_9ACTN|nr:hypothetical protein [Streptomyces sp. MBT51]MBK3596826.1 hypothetical protein [Streptomyces sp. MBT51]